MAQTTASEFLSGFVLPLVRGGKVTIGAPIDMNDYLEMCQGLSDASLEVSAIDAARHEVLSEVVLEPPPLIFDEEELALCASVHNLLFLSHPRLRNAEKAAKKVLTAAATLADQSLCEDRTSALSRHGLLHALFSVTRADMRISWWLGSRTFLGQKPPSRLTSLRTIRRVREEKVWVGFAELLKTSQSQPVLASILRRSPLTPLLSMALDGPAMRLEETTFLFRDAELARAIAYTAIIGDKPEEILSRPAAFGAALEQMLERHPPPSDVRTLTAFVVYLNTLLFVTEQELGQHGPPRPSLLAELAPERTGQRLRGLVAFFAVPAAILRVDPRLACVPGITGKTLTQWQKYQQKIAEAVGDAVIEALASRFQRHLKSVIESTESVENPDG